MRKAERILTRRLGQLVHEAFHVDGVLVGVHAAPEAWRHVRVAHRVIDQEVRHVVAVGRLGAARREALELHGIHAVLQVLRQQRRQDRLTGDADVQSDEVAVLVETARQLAHRGRMVLAVRHVLFARPHHLDRDARHLLGDQHRLPHVVGAAAPAEAGAEHLLVDLALGDRQLGGLGRRRESCFAVLRAAPHLAFVGRVEHRGVHRLHGDMVLPGEAVGRLDLLGGAVDRRLGIARLVADEGFAGAEAVLQHGGDVVLLDLAPACRSPIRPAASRARTWRSSRCRR